MRPLQKKWEPLTIYYLEGYTLHLDKRREPIPCPGSHTGAADSVPLRTRRRISAQRGLKIRGLNESAGSGPGAGKSVGNFRVSGK